MSNDWEDQNEDESPERTDRASTALDSTDGWVRPRPDAPPGAPLQADDEFWTTKNESPTAARGMTVPRPPGAPEPKPHVEPLADLDSGKTMAIFSHCSIVLGLPVFLVPLIQRDNAFALHHAKAAAVNYIALLIFFGIALLTCGLGTPLIFLCYLPAIVGIVNASNGERASSLALGEIGESIFSSVRPKSDDEPRRLEE